MSESSKSRAAELLPKSSLGQYQIRGRIGSGGMGDVYDAIHTALDKRVAIKTLRRRYLDDQTVVQRFLREGQLASRIRHPNIVDVTDVGLIDGLPCLVMEYCEGETLSALVKRGGALPLVQLVDWLVPICAALDHAHQSGILHRDLKPSNIFLSRSWNGEIVPKILDFGISKLVDDMNDPGLTTDSAFVGTPHYASPESMRGEKMDARADQYSMGVALYEGAVGVRPFADRGFAFGALAIAICDADYKKPRELKPDLPAAFERVVLKAMELQPANRYPSMKALGAELLPFASERVRMIWAPAFGGASARDVQNETAVFANAPAQPGSGSTAVGTQILSHSQGGSMSRQHAMTGPPSPSGQVHALSGSGSHPFSGAVPVPDTHRHSGPIHADGPSYGGGFHPSATPPPFHDRTPSQSIQSMHGMHGMPVATQPRGTSPIAIVAVASLIACVAAVGVLVATRSSAAKPEKLDTQSAQGDTYPLSLQTTPDSANIELDGLPSGSGKIARAMPKDGRQHNLRVSAPGYETVLVSFDDGHPPPSSIALRPSPNANAGSTTSAKPNTPQPQPNPGTAMPGKVGGGTSKTPKSKTDNIDPWE